MVTANGSNGAGINGTAEVREPRGRGEAEDALLGMPITLDYRPSWSLANQMGLDGDGGRWAGGYSACLSQIEQMLPHPDVKLPYGIFKSAIANVKFSARAEDQEQARFGHAVLKKMWDNHLPQLQLSYDYGWCGYELCYSRDEKNGTLDFETLYDLHPLDCWALTTKGRYRGFRLKGVGGLLSGASKISTGGTDLWGPGRWPAKGLWLTHDRRWDRFYGQSQLYGAWRPWRRLAGRDACEEVLDGAVYRRGYQGPTVYYPAEDFKKEGGGIDYDAARNVARQMAEQAKAGFSVALPNTLIPNTNMRKWEFGWGESSLVIDPLLTYESNLQRQISRGVGVPPELFEASEVGSGWSGRMIPLLGFYVGQVGYARNIVRELIRQVVVPLLQWNYGKDAWFECDVELQLPPGLAPKPEQGGPGGGGQPPTPDAMQPPQPGGGNPAPDMGPLSALMPGGDGGGMQMSLIGEDELDPAEYPPDDVDAWSVVLGGEDAGR